MGDLDDRVARIAERARSFGQVPTEQELRADEAIVAAEGSGMAHCCECGGRLVSGRFYREVIGWDRPRAGGGTNQIVLRSETGRLRCADCVDMARRHGQGSLQL